jgi:CubicO group peptidase (beta-lactamase class C family)
MRRSDRAILLVTAAVAAWSVAAGRPQARQEAPRLDARISAMRETTKVPALGGVVFTSDRILAEAVSGIRRLGSSEAATTGDIWHIGSITKSFTATLAAQFVERGQLSWSMTLGDLLGSERAGAYAGVTVEHLLSHRAGLGPASQTSMLLLGRSGDNLPELRQRAVTAALKTTPTAAPGAAYQYSNAGYVIVGAILETKAGRSWEALLRADVLEPLRLGSAGFGAPGTAGAVTQPRGHRRQADGQLLPVEPGPFGDNPPLLGPAGTLHMTLGDLVRWAQEHLRGERGRDGLVKAATFQRLHRPPVEGASYALGWVVQMRDGARTVWHNGSNTLWYTIVAFDPAADVGVALATNGSIGAQPAIDKGMRQVLDEWIARKRS